MDFVSHPQSSTYELIPWISLLILDLDCLILKKDRVLCNTLIRCKFISQEKFFVTELQLVFVYLVNDFALPVVGLTVDLSVNTSVFLAENITLSSANIQ
jgi:hypothetical protein